MRLFACAILIRREMLGESVQSEGTVVATVLPSILFSDPVERRECTGDSLSPSLGNDVHHSAFFLGRRFAGRKRRDEWAWIPRSSYLAAIGVEGANPTPRNVGDVELAYRAIMLGSSAGMNSVLACAGWSRAYDASMYCHPDSVRSCLL